MTVYEVTMLCAQVDELKLGDKLQLVKKVAQTCQVR